MINITPHYGGEGLTLHQIDHTVWSRPRTPTQGKGIFFFKQDEPYVATSSVVRQILTGPGAFWRYGNLDHNQYQAENFVIHYGSSYPTGNHPGVLPAKPASVGQLFYRSDLRELHAYGGDPGWANLGGSSSAATFDKTVENFWADDTNPPDSEIIGNDVAVLSFDPSTNQIAYFDIHLDGTISLTSNISFQIRYSMSTAVASLNVKLTLDYDVIGDGDSPITPNYGTQISETIAAVSTVNYTNYTATTMLVTSGNLTGNGGGVIRCRLTRDTTVGSNHTGDFRLFSLRAYQS